MVYIPFSTEPQAYGRFEELTHSDTSVMFLVTPSAVSVCEPRYTNLTIQDRSKVFHIPQTVRVDLAIRAKGIQYFPTKARIGFRVFSEHGYRECCQTSRLGFEFSSALRLRASERTVSRPANKILNVSSLMMSWSVIQQLSMEG